jgi:hypothetical protein
VAPDGALLALASANDWIVLQDMSEKTVGNSDNSALVLSLADVSSGNADTYVVHYDLCDVGTFFRSLEERLTDPFVLRVEEGQRRGPETAPGCGICWLAVGRPDRPRQFALNHTESAAKLAWQRHP